MFKSETTSDETKACLQRSAHVQFKGNANAVGLTKRSFSVDVLAIIFYLKDYSFAFHSAVKRFHRKT